MAKVRYLIGFGTGLILAILLIVTIIFTSAGVLNPSRLDSGWTAWVRVKKFQLLDGMQNGGSGRLVIVAGSNAVFGIDAGELQRLTSLPAINAASHAGIRFRLERQAPLGLLRRGDIAILPLEYPIYGERDTLNQLTVEVAHQEGMGFFQSLPLLLKVEYLRSLQPGFLLRQIKRRYSRAVSLPSTGYWQFGLNGSGDLDLATAEPAQEYVRDRGASIVSIRTSITPQFRALLCQTVRQLVGNGVRVIGTPDNVYLSNERAIRDRHILMQKASDLFRSCGGEWLPVKDDGLQPLEHMLDTEFHPNLKGREKRTRVLAQALCETVLSDCVSREAP